MSVKINKVSAETKTIISNKSALTLPDKPSAAGYNASSIKKALSAPILDTANSAIGEIDRVVDEINEKIIGSSSSGLPSKLDKTAESNKLYGTNSSGSQYLYNVSKNANSDSVVQRDGAQIVVPETPVNDNHAASKKYVLDSLDVTFDNKVDKRNPDNSYKAYVQFENGEDGATRINKDSAQGDTIVQRTSSGEIIAANPTTNNSVVTRQYADANYASRSFFESMYCNKTGDNTATLQNAKPAIDSGNYLFKTINSNEFNIASSDNKFVFTKTLDHDMKLSNTDGIDFTAVFALSVSCSVEFMIRILMNGVAISSGQAFGVKSYSGNDTYTNVNQEYMVARTDLIESVQTYSKGSTLTVELAVRTDSASVYPTVHLFCGADVSNAERYSYSGMTYTNTVIDTNQIADGSITEEKLSEGVKSTFAKSSDVAQTYATKAEVNAKYTKPSTGIPGTDIATGAISNSKLGSDVKNTYATKTEVAGKYTKPSTGIPESDLSSAVVEKLNSGSDIDIPTPSASDSEHILRVNMNGTGYELAAPEVAVDTHPYIDLGNFILSGTDYTSTIDFDVLASLGTANTVVKVTLPSVGSLYGVLSKIGTDYVSSLSTVSNGTVTVYALEIDETSAAARVYVRSASELPAVSSADAGKIPVVSDDGTGYELEDKPEGIPTGGTTGQVLTKDSDGTAEWQTPTGGIVPVSELPTANEAEYNKHALYLYDGALNFIIGEGAVGLLTTLSTVLPIAIYATSAASVGTKCYVFGGLPSGGYSDQIVEFDTETQTVTTLSAVLPSARSGTSAVSVGTKCYVFGGLDSVGYSDQIVEFNTETQTVTTLQAKLPSKRQSTGAAAVGTKCYVFGGWNGSVYNDQIVEFDTETQTVTTLSAVLPSARYATSAASVGTKCYVFGGWNSSGRTNQIVEFDTETQTVTTLSAVLPSARQSTGAAAVGTKCYVFGGIDDGGYSDQIFEFDTEKQIVTTLQAKLPSKRQGLSAAAVGTKCYSFGGYYPGNRYDQIIELDPNGGGYSEYSYKTLLTGGGGSAVKVFVAGAPNGYPISVSGSESQYTSSNGDIVYMTTGDGFTLGCQDDAGGYGKVWYSDGMSEEWQGDTDRWSYYSFGEKTVVGGYLKQTGVDSVPPTPTGYNVIINNTGVLYSGTFSVYEGTSDQAPKIGTYQIENGSAETIFTESNTLYIYIDSSPSGDYFMDNVTTSGGVSVVSGGRGAAYGYSDRDVTLSVTGDGEVNIETMCFVKGTKISLADGTVKNVEEIDYSDNLMVWNFNSGKLTSAYPLWIMKERKTDHYYNVELEDGTVIKVTGGGNDAHRLYNVTKKSFVYATECVNDEVFTLNGIRKVISCNRVDEKVEYYNIITDRHMNLFAEGILTSCRYNNIYPFTDDMRFDMSEERKITSIDDLNVPYEYYIGMRLGENDIPVEDTRKYVERLNAVKKEK